MEQEKKQAVALMRYSAIAPLITGTQEDYESLSAYFRTVSAKGIKAPDGSLRHYSPGTLEKWYLAYRKSGFDALVPTGRSDCGVSRKIDGDLKEQIIYLKHHYPRMSAAAIYKQLQDNGSIRSGQLSESTVCRFINQLVLQQRLTNNQDMRRYERPHINEVWVCFSLHSHAISMWVCPTHFTFTSESFFMPSIFSLSRSSARCTDS